VGGLGPGLTALVGGGVGWRGGTMKTATLLQEFIGAQQKSNGPLILTLSVRWQVNAAPLNMNLVFDVILNSVFNIRK